MTVYNEYLIEDLLRLREEIRPKAFNSDGAWKNFDLAETYLKINSCLYKGYPRRSIENKAQ